jgi:hypothetical protein
MTIQNQMEAGNIRFTASRGYAPEILLKVRNMQLGYNLPKRILSNTGIKSMKIYLNADTPFIFSGLASNLDPEAYDGVIRSETPSTRMFSLGVNVDF